MEQTQAASSPAEVEDVFNGQHVTLDEFSRYRKDGELPERFKPAEAGETAPAEETTEESETEPESEPEPEEEAQEQPKGKRKQTGPERIAELKATIAKIEKGLGIKTEAESSPAKPEPKSQPVQQFTRPKPTAEDKSADGTPKFSTYEDFVEELADWKSEQRLATRDREQQEQAQARQFNAKVEEAEARYENFKEVVGPTATALNEDPAILPVVKQMLLDSEVLPDLLFTIGSDPAELAKFVKMAKGDPGKAIRYIALTESLISEELSKDSTARDDKGKFVSKEPAPEPKKTSAPKPPSPVGGASSRAFDVSDESLSAEEWMRKRNQDIQKRRS